MVMGKPSTSPSMRMYAMTGCPYSGAIAIVRNHFTPSTISVKPKMMSPLLACSMARPPFFSVLGASILKHSSSMTRHCSGTSSSMPCLSRLSAIILSRFMVQASIFRAVGLKDRAVPPRSGADWHSGMNQQVSAMLSEEPDTRWLSTSARRRTMLPISSSILTGSVSPSSPASKYSISSSMSPGPKNCKHMTLCHTSCFNHHTESLSPKGIAFLALHSPVMCSIPGDRLPISRPRKGATGFTSAPMAEARSSSFWSPGVAMVSSRTPSPSI
mmetsp:Transcript_27852/g.57728  ORF Transcript_27852/g.57728 Transcript_27852/m.57728 type:complete len:271 (-) Transcript_27852:355-1167(-)